MRRTEQYHSSLSIGLLLVCVLLSGCAVTGPPPDRKRGYEPVVRNFVLKEEWQEMAVTIPAYPQEEFLAEFQIVGTTSYAFLADTQSIRVDDDGVVRYTVIARSASGVANVKFEGMRCETREFRTYALGSPQRTWTPAQQSGWTFIEKKIYNDYHYSLYRYYLCPDGAPRRNTGEAVAALNRGYPQVTSGR